MHRTFRAVVEGCAEAQAEGWPIDVAAMEAAAEWAAREIDAIALRPVSHRWIDSGGAR